MVSHKPIRLREHQRVAWLKWIREHIPPHLMTSHLTDSENPGYDPVLVDMIDTLDRYEFSKEFSQQLTAVQIRQENEKLKNEKVLYEERIAVLADNHNCGETKIKAILRNKSAP